MAPLPNHTFEEKEEDPPNKRRISCGAGEPTTMPPCLNFWAFMYNESHHTFQTTLDFSTHYELNLHG